MIASQIAFLSLAIAPLDAPLDATAAPPAPQMALATAEAVSAGRGGSPAPAGTSTPPAGNTAAPSASPGPAPAQAPVSAQAKAPDPVTPPATSPAAAPAPQAAASPDPMDEPAVAPPRDPFEHFNRVSYAISQPIDRFVLRPAAMVYKTVVPHILRDGVRNFLANLFTPVIFVNDVLQLRPKRALHTTTRFLLNATLGIGGVFDVAKRHPFAIKAHPNGFADTLGYYGVPSGPYLYLPVVGPASPRDAAGYFADWFSQPRLLNRMLNPDKDRPLIRSKLVLGQKSMITMIVGGLDQRAQNDAALKAITEQSVDPYAALRSSYLQSREGEIAALKGPDGTARANASFDDPLRDPAEKTQAGPQLGAPVPR